MYLRYGNAKGVDQNIYKYVLEIISNTVTAGSRREREKRLKLLRKEREQKRGGRKERKSATHDPWEIPFFR